MPPLKLPYGDRHGVLVHASQTERGLACECVCVECGDRLVAKRGQKTRPHFAHYTSERHCDGESLLHRLGKLLLAQRIDAAISARQAVPVVWECGRCYRDHEADLVSEATGVAVEHRIRTDTGAIRPDVTVFGPSDTPQSFIEVVVTHEPEQPVYDYARSNGVALAEFRLTTATDLEALDRAGSLRPANATLRCRTPSCSSCGDPLHNEPTRYFLYVVVAPCWKCRGQMKVALWEADGSEMHDSLGGPSVFGPSGLSVGITVEEGQGPAEEELAVARGHGVVIKRQYSRTIGAPYLANTCQRCGAFVGANHNGDYANLITTSNRVASYQRCDHCGCGTCNCKDLPPRARAGAGPPTPPAPVVAVPPEAVTRIKCGHCGSRHATVDEVRACSARS